jgi:hypothetical protein
MYIVQVYVSKEKQTIQFSKRTTIVYQLFDNVSYMVKKPDGIPAASPRKAGTGGTTWRGSWT